MQNDQITIKLSCLVYDRARAHRQQVAASLGLHQLTNVQLIDRLLTEALDARGAAAAQPREEEGGE